jgi:lipid-binding SYLF domain-containing protein
MIMNFKSVSQQLVMMGLLVISCIASNAYADDVSDANDTIKLFKKTDPDLSRFFKSSVGYAVFPNVGKGGFGIGGAYGSGTLYEGGEPVGRASLTQVTIGLQVGGQAYAEIIFFETQAVLSDFKAGNLAFSGQVSGVALAAGASANANYQWGVAVFTATRGGLMVEASVGGQKFSYTAFEKKGEQRGTR